MAIVMTQSLMTFSEAVPNLRKLQKNSEERRRKKDRGKTKTDSKLRSIRFLNSLPYVFLSLVSLSKPFLSWLKTKTKLLKRAPFLSRSSAIL